MRRRAGSWLGTLAVTAVAAAGCATLPRPPGAAPIEPALAGWDALGGGKPADAEKIFTARLAVSPSDPLALLGRATVAYDRGEDRTAAETFAAALRALSTGVAPIDGAAAPVAAGRLRDLAGELSAADRARLARALRPADLAQMPALPWLARVELARLADELARLDSDATALARDAAADGCARLAFEAGALGPFGHVDLDRAVSARLLPVSAWRTVGVSGCRLDLPASISERADARIVRAAFQATAGAYDVVIDLPDEARLAIDGVEAPPHGSTRRYGPRMSAVRVTLPAGRHDLTLRLASNAGQTELAVYVLPAGGRTPVQFVDPRAGPERIDPTLAVRRAPVDDPPAGGAFWAYAMAFSADRRGAVDEVAAALGRLASWPRFASGLSLAGEIARDDPTRPASFSRDAARRSLHQAVEADPALARAWQTLAAVELEDDRPREAIAAARRAAAATPTWWAPDLLLARALTVRGLDFDASQELAQAAAKSGGNAGGPSGESPPCPVLEALRREADDRRQLAREDRLTAALGVACAGDVDARVERARARGANGEAIALLRGALRMDPDRDDLAGDLAQLLIADGHASEAIADLAARAARDPEDPLRRVRLADAQAAAGQAAAARQTIAAALATRPDVAEVRRSAGALGVPLPLDAFRIDGRAAIRAFEAAGHSYTAPAVIVLDEGVTRVFPTGATMTITHEIVRVDSKDAIDRWGEIQVPAGAEILTLRTHKRDGSTREPEEIAGKDSISAADLGVGDYVEWELLETEPPSRAFAPGFLADRFFFQSFDAPLARSEMTLVVPADMPLAFDARAGAPGPESRAGADGTRIVRFAVANVPQLFAERSAVPAIEYVPSVRPSSGVAWSGWSRFLAEELHEAARVSPAVRALADKLRTEAGAERIARAAAIVDWVTENIEATDQLAEPAGFTLARGRGSRIALALALADELGVPAEGVLARSRLVADAAAPTPPEELDDFGDTLIAFDVGGPAHARKVYADLRLRHAAFGYVPPGLDGARTLSLRDGTFGVARGSAGEDRRTIDMTIRLDERGGGVAVATEELAGWPALEWADLLDRLGADRVRLREDFEQRWLGVQFPGARLRDLQVDLPRDAAGRVGTAHLRYSFVSSHLAIPVERAGGHEMRIEPTFFRSQPGRRFAAEPQRSTGLVLGFDVPTRMTATMELPKAARLDAPGIDRDLIVARAGGYRFVEARDVEPGRPNVLVLRRESTLPIMRIAPSEYAGVAADLRRVDGAEQAEIRIRLGAAGRGAGTH